MDGLYHVELVVLDRPAGGAVPHVEGVDVVDEGGVPQRGKGGVALPVYGRLLERVVVLFYRLKGIKCE